MCKALFQSIKNKDYYSDLKAAILYLLYNENNIPVAWNLIKDNDYSWASSKEIWLYTKPEFHKKGYQKYLLSYVAPLHPGRTWGSDTYDFQRKTFAYYDKFSREVKA